MKSPKEIPNLAPVFGLIQFYGATLENFRFVLDREDELLEKNNFVPAEVGKLLDLREQRCHLGLGLKMVAIELKEEYGFCIPDINGWRLVDQHRFVKEPFPSLRDQLK